MMKLTAPRHTADWTFNESNKFLRLNARRNKSTSFRHIHSPRCQFFPQLYAQMNELYSPSKLIFVPSKATCLDLLSGIHLMVDNSTVLALNHFSLWMVGLFTDWCTVYAVRRTERAYWLRLKRFKTEFMKRVAWSVIRPRQSLHCCTHGSMAFVTSNDVTTRGNWMK